MAAPARLGGVRFVAVDGPAGSGKTTFAGRLAAVLRRAGIRVAEIHIDDLLDGWTDMASCWPRVDAWILAPLRRGEAVRYRRYDWVQSRFDQDWTGVLVPDVLLLEGVTSARNSAVPELSLSAFVVAERALCLRRGIARDGEAVRAEWLAWMADEDRHFAVDGARERADVLVDGAPTAPHDPELEYIRLLNDR